MKDISIAGVYKCPHCGEVYYSWGGVHRCKENDKS